MKILFLLNTVGEGSGPLQRAYAIAKLNPQMHVDVMSFLSSYKNLRPNNEIADNAIRMEREFNLSNLTVRAIGAQSFTDVPVYFKLFKIFKREGYDVIFCHHSLMSTLGLYIAWIAKIRTIVKVEMTSLKRRKKIQIFLDFFSYALSSSIVVISKSTLNSFNAFEKYFYKKKVSQIYNGVIVEECNTANVSTNIYNFNDRDVLIATVGRLHKVKNQTLLLDAFSIAKKLSNQSIKLLLVGDGTERDALEQRAVKLGIDNDIIFTGYVSRKEVFSLLRRVDIYCMTSHYEGFSESLLQAMYCECAPILVDIPSFSEAIKKDVHGVLIPKNNVDSLSRAIVMLSNDKYARCEYGRNSKKRVLEKYDMEIIVEKYMNLILSRS
jgi:glycosyltransferase involved in cell wall biosynthesis